MPKKPAPPPPYPPEFRRRLIELVRAGQNRQELAWKFEPTAQSMRNWVRKVDLDEGKRIDGPTTEERAELVQLRRENRTLREEREILRRAAVWFAQEPHVAVRSHDDDAARRASGRLRKALYYRASTIRLSARAVPDRS